jgi:hypothetical protein
MGSCTLGFSTGNTSKLYYLQDNEYIISTWGETLEARCTGQNAKTLTLTLGVHDLILHPSCSISSRTWSASAIAIHQLNYHLVNLQLPRVNALNLSALLNNPSFKNTPFTPLHAQRGLVPIPLADLQHIRTAPLDIPPSDNLVRNIMILVVLALFIMGGAYLS